MDLYDYNKTFLKLVEKYITSNNSSKIKIIFTFKWIQLLQNNIKIKQLIKNYKL